MTKTPHHPEGHSQLGCGRFVVLPLHSEANSLKNLQGLLTSTFELERGLFSILAKSNERQVFPELSLGRQWGHQSAALCLAFPGIMYWGALVQNASLAFSDCFDFTAVSEIL